MSDLIVTRCACCQQPLGLENRADLAEAQERRLRVALSLIYREADVPDVNEVAFRVRNLVRNALERAVGP